MTATIRATNSAVVIRPMRSLLAAGVTAHGASAGDSHGGIDAGAAQSGGGTLGSRPAGGGPGNVWVASAPSGSASGSSSTGAGPCGNDPAVHPEPSQYRWCPRDQGSGYHPADGAAPGRVGAVWLEPQPWLWSLIHFLPGRGLRLVLRQLTSVVVGRSKSRLSVGCENATHSWYLPVSQLIARSP